MIYGERQVDGIIEKGIFLSLDEFAYYRKEQGYSSTEEINKQADEINRKIDQQDYDFFNKPEA